MRVADPSDVMSSMMRFRIGDRIPAAYCMMSSSMPGIFQGWDSGSRSAKSFRGYGSRAIVRFKEEKSNGCKIRQESSEEGRKGNARAEKRNPEKRRFRQESNEPETGYRHRTLASPERGGQS